MAAVASVPRDPHMAMSAAPTSVAVATGGGGGGGLVGPGDCEPWHAATAISSTPAPMGRNLAAAMGIWASCGVSMIRQLIRRARDGRHVIVHQPIYMTVTQDAVGRRVVLSPQEALVAGGPAEEFEQRVQALFRTGSRDLLVDLRQVPTIDS